MQNITHNDLITSCYIDLSPEEMVVFEVLFQDCAYLETLYEEIELPYTVLINYTTEPEKLIVNKLIHYADKVHRKVHLN